MTNAYHPRFDGIYVSSGPESPTYLRLYPTGQACTYSGARRPAAEVIDEVVFDGRRANSGRYAMLSGELVVEVRATQGRIVYTGDPTLDPAELNVRGHSHINGNDFQVTFRFEPVSDLPPLADPRERTFELDIADDVRLVVPFVGPTGIPFPAGLTGSIFTFKTPLVRCFERDLYEVGFDPDPQGRELGMMLLPSARLERVSVIRRPGELREGERVKLLSTVYGPTAAHEPGTLATILTRHVTMDGIFHDIAIDFSDNVKVRRDQLEPLPGRHATVTWSTDGSSVGVSFKDGNAF